MKCFCKTPTGSHALFQQIMTFSRLCAAATVSFLAISGWAQGQSLLGNMSGDVKIDGLTTTMDPETGIATVSGDVRVEYQDVQIRCASASYNNVSGNVHATGGVVIWRAGTIYRGDSIDYNVITGELSGNNVRSGMPAGQGSFFYSAKKFTAETQLLDRLHAEDVSFTMHDLANPNFHVSSREMNVHPGQRVELQTIKYYAGNTPILYFPSLSQSVEQDQGFRVSPGYNNRWGAFVLNQFTVFHGNHTEARYRIDLRSSRGLAGGFDFYSMRHQSNRQNFGHLKFYGLSDSDTAINATGSPRQIVDRKRYRFNFQHRIYLPGPDVSTWYIDFDINKISDVHFYEDFFFNEFRTTPEPDNQISIIKRSDAFVATLMARGQLNKFYRSAERLPELSFDFVRRPIFGTGIQHQGTFAAGVYKERLGKYEQVELTRLQQLGVIGAAAVNADPLGAASAYAGLLGLPSGIGMSPADVLAGLNVINSRLSEPGYTRFHTYHEFLYPKTFFGWLNLTPRVGAGFTSYHSIDGSMSGKTNFTRGILSLGLEATFKVSRTWSDVNVPALGLDGIRHVFQPYLNYSYLDATQDVGLPAIDRLAPTTRPRSVDVGLFTAVDALRSWNVARVGFYNLLQTRRDYSAAANPYNSFYGASDSSDRSYAWAGMNTYIDVFARDPEFGRDLSNLYNDLFWRPVPWISLTSQVQLPISSGRGSFTELNHGITFLPNRYMSVQFGHQYLSNNPYFQQDSNLFYSRVYTRLGENWGFAMNHIFEADDGTMQFQSYSLTRDLSSWILSIGALVRDNRGGANDFGILLGFTLKEFPQLNFDLDVDPSTSGSNGNGGNN